MFCGRVGSVTLASAFLEKRDRAESAVESVRGRYGKGAIRPASLLGDLKMPGDGREEVVMPGLMYR